MTDEQRDLEDGKREWSADFDNHINNPPKEGDILRAAGSDANARLVVELEENQPPFIYGRAYVPEVVGQALGWFLQDKESANFHGWKCILLPRARTDLIRKLGLQRDPMEVKSLKVIRYSQSGKAILCEVHEYANEEMRPGDGIPEPASVEETCGPDIVMPNPENVDTDLPAV